MICYPLYTFYELRDIRLLTINPSGSKEKYSFELIQFCGALVKEKLTVYYLIMAFVIFFPMLTIFTSFYFNIAVLIWKHRKPVSSVDKKIPVGEDVSTLSTKRSTSCETQNYTNIPKRKNVQVERKIRTFRTVLLLMVSFNLCRLPYWSYYIVRLLNKEDSIFSWNLHFTFISLNLLNCILDPLLYTYLHETISALKIINDFFFKVCCCCFSNDFEDFERNNLFVIDENYKPNIKGGEKANCACPNQQPKGKF